MYSRNNQFAQPFLLLITKVPQAHALIAGDALKAQGKSPEFWGAKNGGVASFNGEFPDISFTQGTQAPDKQCQFLQSLVSGQIHAFQLGIPVVKNGDLDHTEG